jgi:hypothetical protein
MNKVKMSFAGVADNPYRTMTRFQYNARKQGWSQEEIDAVILEATSGDYDHLLQTIMRNIE